MKATDIEKRNREFGQWLKKHRAELGINQAEAGRRARMSRTQWTRLELGESGTRRENIPAIAAAVEADLYETYRKAGYSPPAISAGNPDFIARFNDLPRSVQEDVTVIVNALWRKYSYKQKAITE